jgi:hypothetical protein
MIRAFLLFALAHGVVALADVCGTRCDIDSQCRGNDGSCSLCRKNADNVRLCVNAVSCGGECRSDLECMSECSICLDNVCQLAGAATKFCGLNCTSDSDCGRGGECGFCSILANGTCSKPVTDAPLYSAGEVAGIAVATGFLIPLFGCVLLTIIAYWPDKDSSSDRGLNCLLLGAFALLFGAIFFVVAALAVGLGLGLSPHLCCRE